MGLAGGRPRDRERRRYAMVIDVTIQGVASLLVGAILGWWLWDSYGAPVWVVMVCILMGVAAAVLTMVRYQRRLERLDETTEGKPGPPA